MSSLGDANNNGVGKDDPNKERRIGVITRSKREIPNLDGEDKDDSQHGADLEEDEDEEVIPKRKEKKGRRKIKIEFIEDKSRRHITFSKRKAGIMKKAYELATLTGTQVLLLVASETGHVYTFATPKLQPLITKPDGKNLIQGCLNAPDSSQPSPTPSSPQSQPPPQPSISHATRSQLSHSGGSSKEHSNNSRQGSIERSGSTNSDHESLPVYSPVPHHHDALIGTDVPSPSSEGEKKSPRIKSETPSLVPSPGMAPLHPGPVPSVYGPMGAMSHPLYHLPQGLAPRHMYSPYMQPHQQFGFPGGPPGVQLVGQAPAYLFKGQQQFLPILGQHQPPASDQQDHQVHGGGGTSGASHHQSSLDPDSQ